MDESENVRGGEEIGLEQAFDRLYDEIEARQAHLRMTAKQLGVVLIALETIPYINPNILKVLGWKAILLPGFAIILGLVFTWLLNAEHLRLLAVLRRYRELQGKYRPAWVTIDTPWLRFLWAPIGTVMAWVFGLGFLFVSIANILIILSMG